MLIYYLRITAYVFLCVVALRCTLLRHMRSAAQSLKMIGVVSEIGPKCASKALYL